MKIIIDNKIPYIKEAVQTIADEIIYAPGKDFTPKLVQDADALIIRTRTSGKVVGSDGTDAPAVYLYYREALNLDTNKKHSS